MQDSQENIQPASDSNSESDNDKVERIVGSSSNSQELNDSGDQAADSQQEQEAEETICLDTDGKDTGPPRKLCAMTYTCRNVT